MSVAARFGAATVRPVTRPDEALASWRQLNADSPWVDPADHDAEALNKHGSWTPFITVWPDANHAYDYPADVPQLALTESGDTNVWGELWLWSYSNTQASEAAALAEISGWGYTTNQSATEGEPGEWTAYGEQYIRDLRRLNDNTLRYQYSEPNTVNTVTVELRDAGGGAAVTLQLDTAFSMLVEKRERYPSSGGSIVALLHKPGSPGAPSGDYADSTDLLINAVLADSYTGAQNLALTTPLNFAAWIAYWGKTGTDTKRRKSVDYTAGWTQAGTQPLEAYNGVTFSGDGVITDALTVTLNAYGADDVRYFF